MNECAWNLIQFLLVLVLDAPRRLKSDKGNHFRVAPTKVIPNFKANFHWN